jgi:signal transduction histidine kinase/ActR/RegA family two-component response regulator
VQSTVNDDEEQSPETLARDAQAILETRERTDEELLRTTQVLERRTAELDAEKRMLEVLNATGRAMSSTLDLQTIVQQVTDAATELSGARFGAFFYNVNTEQGGAFSLFTLSGAPREAFEKLGMPRATAIFAPTFRGESPIRSDDVTKDPRYGREAPHHGMPKGHLPVCSYLAVSVVSRSGEVLGGLFFGHPDPGVFDDRAERLVAGIAGHAALAIDNARLYADAKRMADERARALEAERQARAELERVSLMKDEFLATLSHELRTPLNAVVGWCDLLLHKPQEQQTQRGLETIARNARAQAQMIDDLLDMNRIIAGKVRLDVQRIELSEVIDAAVDSIAPSAQAKGIRLRKVVDPRAGPVVGDPTRLQQIVWNLLSNAVKFTPKGGRVDVHLSRVNSHVEIVVTDSGIGIAAETLPHVFERFRQADSSTTRAYGGLGLGLAIVKQLVELHGGSVRATSEGPGQGTSFIVALPLHVVRADPSREHPQSDLVSPPPVPLSLSGIRVLVVDDEPDARELLKVTLESRDAIVVTAASADEALERIGAERPDVIVSDIGMPGKDGYALINEVRARPVDAGGRTPAIALTAFARSEDRTRAMLAGFQVHMAKPIAIEELIATVASLTGRAWAAR